MRFQSTLPSEKETKSVCPQKARPVVSIRSPPKGERLGPAARQPSSWSFNPAPSGERRLIWSCVVMSKMFQSTLPSERSDGQCRAAEKGGFNPLPSERRATQAIEWSRSKGFQSRPSEESDSAQSGRHRRRAVSIHAPLRKRRATRTCNLGAWLVQFQSTLPSEKESDQRVPCLESSLDVSIHAPLRKGATHTLPGEHSARAGVSIHAPLRKRRATASSFQCRWDDSLFQSTLPSERRRDNDQHRIVYRGRSVDFNPTLPPKGERRLPAGRTPLLPVGFNPPPLGADWRHRPGGFGSPSRSMWWATVSIHAPLKGSDLPGYPQRLGWGFQSTLPSKEATGCGGGAVRNTGFLSRSPRKEATC